MNFVLHSKNRGTVDLAVSNKPSYRYCNLRFLQSSVTINCHVQRRLAALSSTIYLLIKVHNYSFV
jgi:hypothetical protein